MSDQVTIAIIGSITAVILALIPVWFRKEDPPEEDGGEAPAGSPDADARLERVRAVQAREKAAGGRSRIVARLAFGFALTALLVSVVPWLFGRQPVVDKKQVEGWVDQRIGTTIPVGTIMAVGIAGSDEELYRVLAKGWVLCDGQVVDTKHPAQFKREDVSSGWWNKPVPNLGGRVLRGHGAGEAVLAFNRPNDATAAVAVAGAGAHGHDLPPRTASISNAGPAIPAHTYLTRDNNGGFGTGFHLATDSTPAIEGQHRHDLGGSIGGGDHGHNVPPLDIVPSYVAVRFIIRVGP